MQALLFAANADERAVLQVVLQRVGTLSKVVKELGQIAEGSPDQPADLVLLALRKEMPLEFIRRLRVLSAAPIVIIADPMSEDLHADLYEAGVDLVVTRPYSARLLVLQVQSLLRRTLGVPFFSLPSIKRGDIDLDPSDRTVQVQEGTPAQLTHLEFRLLYTLMMHPNRTFPSEKLVEHIWGYSGRGDRDLVRGLVRRLRTKIEPNPASPQYVVTVPRVGYMFKYTS